MKRTCSFLSDCTEPKKILFNQKGYPIKKCSQCGHTFTPVLQKDLHLSTTYSDAYFFEGKDGYPNYLNQEKILYKYGKRYAKIVSKYKQPGKMLDVGCAAGFLLKGFADSGWSCKGIEPNATMVAYGKTQLNLDIVQGGLENFKSNEKFDLVNLIQVTGHFYDIDKAMQNISAVLKNDGVVLVESWNMKSLVARIMGKNWHEYSPPSVVHWFSDKTLKQLFEFYGFELIDKGYPAKKINIKHALSFFKGKSSNFFLKEKVINFFEKTIGEANLIYPPVDVKWYIFRKK